MNIHPAPNSASLRAAATAIGIRSRSPMSSSALPCSRTSCCSFLSPPGPLFTAESATRFPLPTQEQLAAEIFSLPRPFSDRRFQNHRMQPVACMLRMGETLQVEDRSAFEVREPSSVHSAALHAAVALAEGSCQIRAVKIEFELEGRLVMGTPTSNGRARVTTASDGVWQTDAPNRERFFRFALDSLDTSAAPARSTGGFKLIARRRGDDRLLFVEGSFGLREFDT